MSACTGAVVGGLVLFGRAGISVGMDLIFATLGFAAALRHSSRHVFDTVDQA
jgi:hypothetical protein